MYIYVWLFDKKSLSQVMKTMRYCIGNILDAKALKLQVLCELWFQIVLNFFS